MSRMADADAARAEADAIADELGASACTRQTAGPYAGREGLAAVRWGLRASELCRARDRAFGRLRSTDVEGFERVDAQFLARMRTLARPKPYAARINRLLKLYAGHVQASKRGDYTESNRLSERSTSLVYDLGFELGYERFCSARPAR